MDCTYEAPEPRDIPVGTHIPTVVKNVVRKLLTHQKRTAAGPDEIPYWFWCDFSHYLAPVIIANLSSIVH